VKETAERRATFDRATLEAAVTSDAISVCSVRVGTGVFGIDTRQIREVLGKAVLQRVPLAPWHVAGVTSYRGDVLSAVSLRALLGMERWHGASCVVVMEDTEYGDRFGLAVDGMGGVTTVSASTHEANPSTLDDRGKALFAGAYPVATGLIVMLDPLRLRHSRLAESGIFDRRTEGVEG
jgi:purine-binding chemotaxis protein CheW